MTVLDTTQNWLFIMNSCAAPWQTRSAAIDPMEADRYRLAHPRLFEELHAWGMTRSNASQLQGWVEQIQKLYTKTTKGSLPVLSEALQLENSLPEDKALKQWKHGQLRGMIIPLYTRCSRGRGT